MIVVLRCLEDEAYPYPTQAEPPGRPRTRPPVSGSPS